MRPVYVRSVGFFAPGFCDVDAFAKGARDASVTAPRDVLPARARRGASLLTRMLADVVAQATARAGFDATSVRTVYASAFGETESAVALLGMRHRGDGLLSPARFSTSVHNTASGLLSIAEGNRAFSTALVGGPETVAMALVEAATLFHAEPGPVVVAFADEPVPEVLGADLSFPPLGVSFGLSDDPDGALATIADLRRVAREGSTAPVVPPHANPIENALPLVRAVLAAPDATATTVVPLDPDAASPWSATVAPPGARARTRADLPPITAILPHQPPMLLLDDITAWEGKNFACRVILRDDSPFVEAGRAPAALAIEYMAQCIAAYVGMRGHARGEAVQIGYLIGARDVTLPAEDFRVGDVLHVTSSHLWGDEALGSFACAIERGAREIASGTLNVYRGDVERMAGA